MRDSIITYPSVNYTFCIRFFVTGMRFMWCQIKTKSSILLSVGHACLHIERTTEQKASL